MNKYTFIVILVILFLIGSLAYFLGGSHIIIFHPQGVIAEKEFSLMTTAAWLMLLVAVPVFLLTFGFAWYYRAENTKARYLPNWDHNPLEESVWWIVPTVIIIVLAVITWRSTHALDPFRPLSATQKPLTVDVVSLNWKWLFIYPAQGIATVNYLEIPTKPPISFKLTAAALMNAFWIPQLGGQEMTMRVW